MLRVVAQQQHAERRIIIHDDAAVAVQHGTARSDDGDGSNSVALCKLRIAIGIDDLQLPEAEQKQGHEPHNRVRDDRQPHLRQAVFILEPEGQANSAPAARTVLLSLPSRSGKYTATALTRQNLGTVPESLSRRYERPLNVSLASLSAQLFAAPAMPNRIRRPTPLPDNCRSCNRFRMAYEVCPKGRKAKPPQRNLPPKR